LIHSDWGWIALVGAGVMVPDKRRRSLAAGGLGALLLALGALRVGGGPGPLPGSFAAGELALVVTGAAVLASAVLPAVRAGWRGPLATGFFVAGIGLLLGDIPALARADPVTLATALGVVAGVAMLAWMAAGMALRRLPPSDPVSPPRTEGRWIAVAGAGVLLAALGPHLLVIFGGVVLAAVSVSAEALRRRRRSSGWAVLITVAALAPAGWLLATIAGDQGLATSGLRELPLSPAAEALLAPMLLLAAWSVAGLWPMPRSALSGLAGLTGALLIARVAIPALPEGLDHWRPLAFPILAVGLWQAVISRRWPAALIGGTLFALISGSWHGVAAAWWLGAGAPAQGLGEYLGQRELAWLSCLAALAGGIGALPATAAGLEGEVVYTTLTVAGLAVLLAAGGSRRFTAPGEP
jgi:hypothetical protein